MGRHQRASRCRRFGDMAHSFANDRHGLRRSKSHVQFTPTEGASWDSASTAANNTPMALDSVVFAAINNPVNNSFSDSELKRSKSTACAFRCKRNSPKATPTNSDVGEANAPETPGDDAVKTCAAPVCGCDLGTVCHGRRLGSVLDVGRGPTRWPGRTGGC